MKREIATKWTTALRGGEYRQTKGALRTDTGFCCLGVLCDLYANSLDARGDWESHSDVGMTFQGEDGFLPTEVMEWSGMRSDIGSTTAHNIALLMQNDSGSTFAEIADFIDAHVEQL